jgi:hypothetical protein
MSIEKAIRRQLIGPMLMLLWDALNSIKEEVLLAMFGVSHKGSKVNK